MLQFHFRLLSHAVGLVNVQLRPTGGALPFADRWMHNLLTGYISKTIHDASTLSSEFFAMNSNQTEITIYASEDLMKATWDELLHTDGAGLYALQRSSTLWRVFQLEVLAGGDPCEGESTGISRRIDLLC